MGRALKLAIVGAGSATFSLGLIRDLCLRQSLWGSQISFMDVDAERLEVIHRLATRYPGELGVDLRFETTLDRKAALADADFVINTAAMPHQPEEKIRAICERHGYYRGTHFGYYQHQLGLMMEVARDVEAICPEAWLIQSSNPVFDGCTLMTRETGVKVVGLCHGHYGYREVAETIGLDPSRVRAQMPGVNHCIWLTHFSYDGRDAYPLIDEWIATRAEAYWAAHRPEFNDNQMSRAAIDLYRLVGLMPIGDTPRMTGWQYHLDLETKQRWYGWLGGFDSEIGWRRYLDSLSERVERIFAVAVDPTISVTKEFPPVATREQQVPIVDALANGAPAPQEIAPEGLFQVNVPNRGAIEGIGDDVVVEVPAVVSTRGIQPVHVGKLPDRLVFHVLLPRILEMERELSAWRNGDRAMLLSQLLWDNRTRTREQAEALLDEILGMPETRGWAARFSK